MSSVIHEKADVLVIGGGGAGLRAAIAVAESDPNLSVLLATKGELGKSGVTATACSDRMAFHVTLPTTEPGGTDAWRYHADDTYRIGGCVSDYDLAEIQAREAGAAFRYLDSLGVPWVRRADGTVDQFVTDGSKYARACYTGPYTANHIEAALVERVKELGNLRVLEGVCAADLLKAEDGAAAGALLVWEGGGEPLAIRAGSVVLATGGAGQVYGVNVFPGDCTGDGYAIAYRMGAELVSMEFVQIGLCSLATGLAMSGSMMRAMPRVINDDGEEFLTRYFPPDTPWGHLCGVLFEKGASWPVSYEQPSRIIDIAVTYERARGRKVYLDYGQNPQGLSVELLPEAVLNWYQEVKGVPLEQRPYSDSPLARLQAINLPSVQWLAERGVRLERGDLVEVAPAAQHFQGGVKVRTCSETSIPGLFAAGEVAGGQHGANRPGGNALMDGQVFGCIAGKNAARFASGRDTRVDQQWLEAVLEALDGVARNGRPASEVRGKIRSIMDRSASVVRVGDRLQQALEELRALEAGGVGAVEGSLAEAVETRNMLRVAEMVLRAALEREESRGPHLRFARFGDLTPVPSNDKWRRYIVIRQGESGMELDVRTPVRPGGQALV